MEQHTSYLTELLAAVGTLVATILAKMGWDRLRYGGRRETDEEMLDLLRDTKNCLHEIEGYMERHQASSQRIEDRLQDIQVKLAEMEK